LLVAGALAVGAPAAVTPNVRGVLVVARSLVCPADEPCDPPAISGTLVFSRSGRVVARARLAPTGRFALRLAPGRYAVRLAPPPSEGVLSPTTVRIARSGTTWLRLTLTA